MSKRKSRGRGKQGLTVNRRTGRRTFSYHIPPEVAGQLPPGATVTMGSLTAAGRAGGHPSAWGEADEECARSDDPLIQMRSADTIEKITVMHPEYLRLYKEKLIKQIAKIEQQEVRWHVAQMDPRLELNQEERSAIFELLLDRLKRGLCTSISVKKSQ